MKKQRQFIVRLALAGLSAISLVTSFAVSYSPSVSAADPVCDYGFYSANDIVTYDPCKEICPASTGASVDIDNSKDTAESVFKFLISTSLSSNGNKPLNAVQAAGILGNMQAESGVDSKTIQSGQPFQEGRARSPGIGGYAFGLVQWDGGRRVKLIEYADKQGTVWSDLKTQLEFLKMELEGSEKAIVTDSEFSKTTDPAAAAVRFRVVFERAGVPHDATRTDAAKAYFEEFKDLAPGAITYGARCDVVGAGGGNMDIVKTALELAWAPNQSHGIKEAKPEYTAALEKVKLSTFPEPVGSGVSCDAYVATVMRYSGLDPNYHCCFANTQAKYMRDHPELYKELGVVTDTGDTSKLVPGAILWRDGHIKFYIGDTANKVLSADASYNQRTAMQHEYLSLNDGSSPYYSFVYIGPNKATADTEATQ